MWDRTAWHGLVGQDRTDYETSVCVVSCSGTRADRVTLGTNTAKGALSRDRQTGMCNVNVSFDFYMD